MIATERYKMTLPGYENVLVGKACVVSLRLRRSPHKRTPRLCGPPVREGLIAQKPRKVSSRKSLRRDGFRPPGLENIHQIVFASLKLLLEVGYLEALLLNS